MQPKLFASLLEAIEKWTESVCESEEWERLNIHYPQDGDELIAKGASAVFDAIVSSAREAEEEANNG